MRQPMKVPNRKRASFAPSLAACIFAGALMCAPAHAASVHLNIPSIVQGPSQVSMAAVQSVIRDARDRAQRDQVRQAARPVRR
jgi:hypothetical protein